MITIPDGTPMVLSISNDTVICIEATVAVTSTGGTPPYESWSGLSGNGPGMFPLLIHNIIKLAY